jgi:predicted nucleotidyltransferase
MRKVQTKLFQEITSKVKQTVKEFDPNAEVILFGSRARGDYKKDSDWDFLILTDRNVNEPLKTVFRRNLFEKEMETGQCFSSFIENRTEWKGQAITDFYQNVHEDGIVL